LAFTVKIIVNPFSPKDGGTASTTHEAAVKDYLDGESITTLHAVSTVISNGYFITTMVFE